MPSSPISGSDPALPSRSASGGLRSPADGLNFQTDFTELAERFSTQGGGGLSPELSVDLALEIVLNEIVEQACVTTGATGAAIVLRRDGEMVCRASSGATAPELGARLDTSSGISGECLRTGRMQHCDDVSADPRADVQASKRLGIRSVMVVPLIRRGELAGIFEVLSSQPHAFGETEERTLEALAGRALNNLEQAAERLKPRPAPARLADSFGEIPRDGFDQASDPSSNSAGWRFDFVTLVLGAAVVVCALLLGIVVGPHLGLWRTKARTRSAASTSPSSVTPSPVSPTSVSPSPAAGSSTPLVNGAPANPATSITLPVSADPTKKPGTSAVPPGGLVIYQDGKQVFRMPAATETEPVQDASAAGPQKTFELSPEAARSSVVQRVDPVYPAEALLQRIQGSVVVEAHIAADGTVRDVQVVSGEPLLAQASSDAVKQWKFKSHSVNGQATEMETRITLNFRLPSTQ